MRISLRSRERGDAPGCGIKEPNVGAEAHGQHHQERSVVVTLDIGAGWGRAPWAGIGGTSLGSGG